jgi:hypothetical protein
MVDQVVLEGEALARLGRLASLDLRSYSTVDFYGSSALGSDALARLSLRAGAFVRQDGSLGERSNVKLSAGVIRLFGAQAPIADAVDLPGSAQEGSVFSMVARDSFEFAGGALAVRGFESTSILANVGFRAVGSGANQSTMGTMVRDSLSTSGSLSIAAPLFSAALGSNLAVVATSDLSLTSLANPPASAVENQIPELGGQLHFEATGGELKSSANISLPSGRLSLIGRTVNITGGRLSVAGASIAFGSTRVSSPGGSLKLES